VPLNALGEAPVIVRELLSTLHFHDLSESVSSWALSKGPVTLPL
jgi:hypothetical protein